MGFSPQPPQLLGELPFDFLGGQCESGISQNSAQLRSPTVDNEQTKEDWIKLFKQAAVEQDPEKLLALTGEICRLLEERSKKLKNSQS